jgi:hypothetical protein
MWRVRLSKLIRRGLGLGLAVVMLWAVAFWIYVAVLLID